MRGFDVPPTPQRAIAVAFRALDAKRKKPGVTTGLRAKNI
jgi:hypothetical protein